MAIASYDGSVRVRTCARGDRRRTACTIRTTCIPPISARRTAARYGLPRSHDPGLGLAGGPAGLRPVRARQGRRRGHLHAGRPLGPLGERRRDRPRLGLADRQADHPAPDARGRAAEPRRDPGRQARGRRRGLPSLAVLDLGELARPPSSTRTRSASGPNWSPVSRSTRGAARSTSRRPSGSIAGANSAGDRPPRNRWARRRFRWRRIGPASGSKATGPRGRRPLTSVMLDIAFGGESLLSSASG